MLRAFAAKFRDAATREGLLTPYGTFGIVVTGALDEKLFHAIAEIIPEGTWEFVCHPGYNDDDLQAANTRLRVIIARAFHWVARRLASTVNLKEGTESD